MVLLGRLLPLALAWISLRVAQGFGSDKPVTFEARVNNKIYDTKPKLKIKGSGFDLLTEEDVLSLKFEPPMAHGGALARATVSSEDVILLELAPGQRWASTLVGDRLMLVEASLRGESLITDPVTLATVVPTPTVNPSNNILYLTVSPHVMVNGTNFDQKSTALFFSPPLLDGTDVTVLVKSSTTIWVSLVNKNEGKRWADEPGPLKLVAIDTGAGILRLREDLGGVTIAEMQADMKGHSLSVENHEEVAMYQSSKVLTIAGDGFNPAGTRFRFGNTLVEGKDYNVSVSTGSATFTLLEGSKWRQASGTTWFDKPLVLLSADAGDGFVPLGATMAKAGRKVATIFADPKLEPSHKEIGRTLTHEFYIKGSGFTKKFPPLIIFYPPIEKDDYAVQVMNKTALKVSLAGMGRGWMPPDKTGELSVERINTGGGMYTFDEPVPVADVVSDDDPHQSGIRIEPNYVLQLYKSSTKSLVIEGEGFPMDFDGELTFGFGGPSEQGSFSCKTLSDRILEVKLAEGYTWAKQAGPLFLLSAKFGDDEQAKQVDYSSPGLKLATVLDDPFVAESQLHVYASHTRHITIQGRGFLSASDPHFARVVLSPTVAGDYLIKDQDWTDEAVTISLSAATGARWADVQTEGSTVNVKVVSIDTGGGPVAMPRGGIVVAEVRMDDATFSCEDSCLYANDGECDEDQNGGKDLNWSGYTAGTNTNGGSFTSQASSGLSSSPLQKGYLGSSTTLDATDDLVMSNTPSCPLGTDCTDCGLTMVEPGTCLNTCHFARDGVCDDRRALGVCPDGTDCQDCGPWGQANFTQSLETISASFSAEEYDDDGFVANRPNDPVFVGQVGNGIGRYKRVFTKHKVIRKESEKAEGIFLDTLWAAIVLVGCSVTVYLAILVLRCAKGEKVSLPIPTNPDVDKHLRR
ncbi:unnamed protein product [Scytosiphon promiscuus]